MPSFSPKDYGSMGLGYAKWQSMMGMSDKTPWGAEETPAPVAPPAAVPKTDTAIIAPTPVVPPMKLGGTFGAAPTTTFGLPPLPSLGNQPMSLEDAIKKSFED